jgi:hypothetical protein
MIRPLLIIGVGGAGGKSIRAMKQELNRILESSGYTEGIPSAWQFLHIDSTNDGVGFPAPMLSANEFHSVVPFGARYGEILGSVLEKGGVAEQQGLLSGWGIPVPTVSINMPPRQDRAIGRLLGLADSAKIHRAIQKSISEMLAPSTQSELASVARCLGNERPNVEPQALIFSSLGGATGSGMFMDIAEILKCSTSSSWANESVSFLFAPDVFKSLGAMSRILPMNALGAMNELVASQWNDVSEQTKNYFFKVMPISNFQSNRASFGSRTNFIIDSRSIKELINSNAVNSETADELINSFACGFVSAIISGEIEIHPSYPIDQFQPSKMPFRDESGLMPEKYADSFMESFAVFKFHPFWSIPSLIEPILEAVAVSKNQTQTWVQFWEGRRSRPLVEAVPFEIEMRRSIVTGWFVARIFGLSKIDYLQSGRSLKIWNPTLETPDWSGFPTPLLDSHQEDMKRESWVLPQVLASAGIALAQFGHSSDTGYINGYRLLKYLGREVTTSLMHRDQWDGKGDGDMLPSGVRMKSTFIKEWVEQGVKPAKEMDLFKLLQKNLVANTERGAALITTLESIQSSYEEAWKDFVGAAFHHMSETWELREDIDVALSDIAEYVRCLQLPNEKTAD